MIFHENHLLAMEIRVTLFQFKKKIPKQNENIKEVATGTGPYP